MIITRRQFIAIALAPLPAAIAAGAAPILARERAFAPLPVDTAAVVGCVSSWRLDLPTLRWSDELQAACLAWSQHMADVGIRRDDGTLRHDPAAYGRECIAAGQAAWAEAVNAWITSPSHLAVLRRGDAARIAMAGCLDRAGWPHWCLRVAS